jgi:predicted RNA binding protein YcfA (HicA-like mRNA interferase family)
MAKQEKFRVVKKKLESKGYELTRISGSHHIFTKKGCNPVSIPVHNATVKPYYVRQVDKL